MKKLLTTYIKAIANQTMKGDSTENSYYGFVKELFTEVGKLQGRKVDVTVNPKSTEAGNPDFRVWDGEYFIIGYIEAKLPGDLDNHRHQEQFDRYTSTFPNVILSDFYQFRLYQDGQQVDSAVIARQFTARIGRQRFHKAFGDNAAKIGLQKFQHFIQVVVPMPRRNKLID